MENKCEIKKSKNRVKIICCPPFADFCSNMFNYAIAPKEARLREMGFKYCPFCGVSFIEK